MLIIIRALQRPVIGTGLTLAVLLLAWQGNEKAIDATITAFTLLAGATWGERAALKVPGKSEEGGTNG